MTEPFRIAGHEPEPSFDVDFAEPSAAAERTSGVLSPLEMLAEALAEDAEPKPPLLLKVPQRPRISLEFDVNVTAADRKRWREQAEDKDRNRAARRRQVASSEQNVDDFRFACLVLQHTNIGVYLNGEVVKDTSGRLTLKDEKVWQMVKAFDPQQAVQRMYGNDQHLEAAAGAVLLASGLDDDVEEVDPTSGSKRA